MDERINIALDIENELLNHLVDTTSLEHLVREGISPVLLYAPKTRAALQFATYHLNETGEAPSVAVMATEFPAVELSHPDSQIEWVVDRLKYRYQKNEITGVIEKMAKSISDPATALAIMRDKAMEIDRNTLSQKNVWLPDDYKVFLKQLQTKIAEGAYRGYTTGFDVVDDFTGGLRPGYLAGIAARPKRMKTFFLLKSFIGMARQGYKPVLYTLEPSEEEIHLRIGCILSGYPWDMAQRRDFPNAKAWQIFEEAYADFASQFDYAIVKPPLEERTVPSLFLQADKLDCDAILISQFYNLHPTREYRNDWEKWGSVVIDLKDAASRPGAERPVYVETQLNREGASMQEMMDADLSQLGLTDKWGQVCDIMFCLFQSKEMRDNQQIEFGIVEARNSDKSSWYAQTEFREYTKVEIER